MVFTCLSNYAGKNGICWAASCKRRDRVPRQQVFTAAVQAADPGEARAGVAAVELALNDLLNVQEDSDSLPLLDYLDDGDGFGAQPRAQRKWRLVRLRQRSG